MLLGKASIIAPEFISAAKQAKTLFPRNAPAFKEAVLKSIPSVKTEEVDEAQALILKQAATGSGFWKAELSTNINELRFLISPKEESATLRFVADFTFCCGDTGPGILFRKTIGTLSIIIHYFRSWCASPMLVSQK